MKTHCLREPPLFTGLVEDIGTVKEVRRHAAVVNLLIQSNLDLGETKLGDSIAIDGVCLTVTSIDGDRLGFDIGPESLRVTALDTIATGRVVHLERALRLSDRLGGHLVQGHVDGIGTIIERRKEGDTLELRLSAPENILRYCIAKGSICLSGVSLTINRLYSDGFDVWLIPHTLDKTHLEACRVGDRLNIESDMVGKYIERFMVGPSATNAQGLKNGQVTMSLLEKNGFLDGGRP